MSVECLALNPNLVCWYYAHTSVKQNRMITDDFIFINLTGYEFKRC